MKEKNILGLLFDPETKPGYKVEIPNTLESLQSIIDAELIDIVEYRINGTNYDIIVDDEGLLKENPIPSAMIGNNDGLLFGKLFICHSDEEGNETSLEPDELVYLPVYKFGDYCLVILGYN